MVNLIFAAEQALKGLTKSVGHEPTSAVVLVAGKSTRAGGTTTKQLTEIDGIPVAVRTLMKFQASEVIDEIIVVAAKEEMELYDGFKEQYGLSKITKVIEGGESRAESAKKGFYAIDKKSKYVAIHDGARCAVTLPQIENVVRAAYSHGAAIAATRSTDTVKRADKDGFVSKTIAELSGARKPLRYSSKKCMRLPLPKRAINIFTQQTMLRLRKHRASR